MKTMIPGHVLALLLCAPAARICSLQVLAKRAQHVLLLPLELLVPSPAAGSYMSLRNRYV